MKRFSELKLSVLFSIIVFIIQFVSSSILPFLTIVGIKTGYIKNPNPIFIVLSIMLTSVVIGTILAKIIGKRILKPITDLNEAIKKVAKGEFNIQLEEISFAKEIREMSRNFNIMIKELKNIETFRNDFITNVSHEFKTPISTIEGYATLLQDEALSKEERNHYIERILSSSKRLSTLSGNILMISKLENQEIVLDKKNYALDEQIRNSILFLEKLWSEKNISLDIDMENIIFYGNKSIISHIWFNFLSNAIKFTPNGGIISVKLKEEKKVVTISIVDTGIGISEEALKHIFEKFYCADKSRYNSGNGLGLTLVKRIVELCDGTIHVKSEKNIGTEFVIKLPNESKEQ